MRGHGDAACTKWDNFPVAQHAGEKASIYTGSCILFLTTYPSEAGALPFLKAAAEFCSGSASSTASAGNGHGSAQCMGRKELGQAPSFRAFASSRDLCLNPSTASKWTGL